MPRTFHPATNTIAKSSCIIVPILVLATVCAGYMLEKSPYVAAQDLPIEQQVPFSHKHHVGGLGIDCRYCHTSVDKSEFAGVPPTKTCVSCHSQLWTGSNMLKPVRDSWSSGKPLEWNRVHNLPQYVNFAHDIHIAKGVGCSTCHGAVQDMPLTWQADTLQMSWCLNCHRNPEKYIRPREEVFNTYYVPPPNQTELGKKLLKDYHVRSSEAITQCAICHY